MYDGNWNCQEFKGKWKSQWDKSSAFEEDDQLKVWMHSNIVVCGVLMYFSWPPLLIQTHEFLDERCSDFVYKWH